MTLFKSARPAKTVDPIQFSGHAPTSRKLLRFVTIRVYVRDIIIIIFFFFITLTSNIIIIIIITVIASSELNENEN